MGHLRRFATTNLTLLGFLGDIAWEAGHRLLMSAADREAARFVRYHPNAQIRRSR